MMKYTIVAAAAVVLGVCCMPVQASPITWATGQTADFNTPADWSGSATPAIPTTSDILIDGTGSNVTYSGSGGDFRINTNVTVSGNATFTQSSGNWFKIGDGSAGPGSFNVASGAAVDVSNGGNTFVGNGSTGTLNVSGGTMKMNNMVVASGSTANFTGGVTTFHSIATNDTSNIVISGGTLRSDTAATTDGTSSLGTLSMGGNVTLSSGLLDIQALEFKPSAVGNTQMSGGVLKANLVRFETAGGMSFSGGLIDVYRGSPTVQADVYALSESSSGFLNFTIGSTGVIDLIYSSVANDATQGYLTSGAVKYNGITDPTNFSVTSDGGTGSLIQLIPSLQGTGVPEPASLGLLVIGGLALLNRRRRA